VSTKNGKKEKNKLKTFCEYKKNKKKNGRENTERICGFLDKKRAVW